MTVKKPELLAPAGDLVRMRYAYAYGADAVYAGQPAFSLRARENGFRNLDDLAEGIADAVHQYENGATEIVYNDMSEGEKFSEFLMSMLERVEKNKQKQAEE